MSGIWAVDLAIAKWNHRRASASCLWLAASYAAQEREVGFGQLNRSRDCA